MREEQGETQSEGAEAAEAQARARCLLQPVARGCARDGVRASGPGRGKVKGEEEVEVATVYRLSLALAFAFASIAFLLPFIT